MTNSSPSSTDKNRSRRKGLFAAGFAIFCILAAFGTAAYHYIQFSSRESTLPIGTSIAGIPVGGLTDLAATSRLEAAYSTPISIRYRDHNFQLPPAHVGFQLQVGKMLAETEYSVSTSDWPSFWSYLWGETPIVEQNAALQATYSEQLLREYLEDVSSRYDDPVLEPWADPEMLITVQGNPGTALDIEAAIPEIQTALFTLDPRLVTLTGNDQSAPAPGIDILENQIRSYLELQEFNNLFSLFLIDLRNDDRIHMNLWQGQDISTVPDIAYSGMSVMKIYILAEFYRQVTDGAFPYELDLVEKSITESSNWTSNLLIEWIGDLNANNGLFRLNETIAALGLEGTFIGGLYDTEEAPGFRFTPSNTREDITTAPDPYMQTTPADIGQLLEGIYRCADSGDGLLVEVFGEQFTQQECTDMIDWLASNEIGVLIEAGVPGDVTVAHKHGWAEGEPIGDAGLVLTAAGDYVLVYYVWYPEYTYWDENSALLAAISRAIYSYFNPLTP